MSRNWNSPTLLENYLGKHSDRFLYRLYIAYILYKHVIPLLGDHPKEIKAYMSKDTSITILKETLFISAKNWKHITCLSNTLLYIHSIVIKRNELLIHAIRWINLKNMH